MASCLCSALQGIKWIKAREEANNLVIIQQSQPKYIDKVLQAIENGLPLMIENLPVDIDAVRSVRVQGLRSCISPTPPPPHVHECLPGALHVHVCAQGAWC
jgi:hypothetical protein